MNWSIKAFADQGEQAQTAYGRSEAFQTARGFRKDLPGATFVAICYKDRLVAAWSKRDDRWKMLRVGEL